MIRSPFRLAAACCTVLATAAAQQFAAGSVYFMSPMLELTPNTMYPGIRRLDPFTGQTFPFVQFTSNAVYPASAKYDPFRDRIVATCVFGASFSADVHAFDAAGSSTVIGSYLVRLAPRGDGKIYGYKAGASSPTVQQIFYLDAANQEQVLLDVGGVSPWLLAGGAQIFTLDPIRSMIYDPRDNSLFLALAGDNVTPQCANTSPWDVQVRKLPLTPDGTALRAPAVCASFDVAGVANAFELPIDFTYGPQGDLVLSVGPSWSGPMPRFLRVDPVTAQMTTFATVGPYWGDAGITCGGYSPLTGKALMHDLGNQVWRAYSPGESGAGTVLSQYGVAGFSGVGGDTFFVVGPIGPSQSLTADTGGVSVSAGGAQVLSFHPGPAFAGDLYLIAGSLSGWSPGIPVGSLTLPINFDAYTDLTLQLANSPSLVNTLGVLPPSGEVTAQVVLPPGVLLGLAGFTLHHAALAADTPSVFTHTSNPVPLVLLP